MKICYSNLKFKFNLRDDNFETEVKLKKFNIEMITEYYNTTKPAITDFLFRNNLVKKQKENILFFSFEKNPLKVLDNEIKANNVINLEIDALKIIYNPLFSIRLIEIFNIKAEEELKDMAWEKVENTKEKTQEMLQPEDQKFLKINIFLASPLILLPFKHNNDLSSESWVINLGNLELNTNSKVLSNSIPIEEKIYDIFDIKLSSIRMQYFPTISFFEEYTKNKLKGAFANILSKMIIKEEFKQRNTSAKMINLIG